MVGTGIWHVLEANTTNILSRCSGPMGSFVYMDPEFFASGELQLCSDVYSFGIVLLRSANVDTQPYMY